jgi:hypothetical protein
MLIEQGPAALDAQTTKNTTKLATFIAASLSDVYQHQESLFDRPL